LEGEDHTSSFTKNVFNNSDITLTAAPAGYRYVTWTGDRSTTGNTRTITDITANRTVNAVFAAPVITINTHPVPSTSVIIGNISGGLSVSAGTTPTGRPLSYQWYSSTTNSNSGGTSISGATGYFAQYTANYLEAAPANASSGIRWSNTSVLIPDLSQDNTDTTDWAIGRGRLNTALIAAAHPANTIANNAAKAAAAYSQGGKDDWFLPSREELNQMEIARTYLGITTGNFWSSS